MDWGKSRKPQHSRSSGRDLNPRPPEYEAGLLTTLLLQYFITVRQMWGMIITICIIYAVTQREYGQMVIQSFQNLKIPSHFSKRQLYKRTISHQHKCLLPFCRQCPIDILRSSYRKLPLMNAPPGPVNHGGEQNHLLCTGFTQNKTRSDFTVGNTLTWSAILWMYGAAHSWLFRKLN
jgi:hypothetical protein